MENQPDLPDRTLPLKVARIPDGEQRSEAELLDAVREQRDALMSELLDELNVVVKRLRSRHKTAAPGLRMADFGVFCARVLGKREGLLLLQRLRQAQAGLVFENEPLRLVLALWLNDPDNQGRPVTAGDLFRELKKMVDENAISWPFSSSTALGKRLSSVQSALRPEIEISTATHNNQTIYRFSRDLGDGGHGGLKRITFVQGASKERVEGLCQQSPPSPVSPIPSLADDPDSEGHQ